jgi:hypothetical protein
MTSKPFHERVLLHPHFMTGIFVMLFLVIAFELFVWPGMR